MSDSTKTAEAVAHLNSVLALHTADPDACNVVIDLGRLRKVAEALNPEPIPLAEYPADSDPAPAESGKLP